MNPNPPEAPEVCLVCRRGEPRVCERCRTRTAEQLAALPGLWDRLRMALVPGPAGAGERVTSTRGEAPMPARLAALSLLAGGSDDARCLFVPAVRTWTTSEPAAGGTGKATLTWHRELQHDAAGHLVMALTDDQAGVLPVKEWLKAWAVDWRHALGHSTALRPATARAPRHNATSVHPPPADALGIAPARAPADRPADPVELDWDSRWPFDRTGWGPATRIHHSYLVAWLPQACDRLPHITDFVASLRALTGAVRSALGDIEDLEYLGRCPDEVTDPATGRTSICGATLWHDPYASVITCPRCHTETGQDHRIWLARRILEAWPIDARRRYPRGLIDVLRKPTCVSCSAPVSVEWIEATERADRERFWRPGTLACPTGCPVFM